MPHHKNNQDEPGNEEDRRWNKVRAKMICPSATDGWNGKHEGNDQDAFTIRDGKDASNQYQRKQTGYNKFATFNLLDKRGTSEEESERNQKLHRGEATES